jgi:hypothetical protein
MKNVAWQLEHSVEADVFEAVSNHRTRITQRILLWGDNANAYTEVRFLQRLLDMIVASTDRRVGLLAQGDPPPQSKSSRNVGPPQLSSR